LSNKSTKEHTKDKNDIEKIFEKNINNVLVIIGRDSLDKLYIGGDIQYKNNELRPFKLKDNLFHKINNDILHVKQIRNNYLCNLGNNLDESNNIFPFEFILEAEGKMMNKKEINLDDNKEEFTRDKDIFKNKKETVKSILSKIT